MALDWQQLIQFMVTIVIGVAGLLFSFLAFVEARKAKKAAAEAGRIVKIQTITIDLTEITQKLERLSIDIQFDEARDLLNEISRRLRRITSPFQAVPDLADTITALKAALVTTKESLNSVRPTDPAKEREAPHAVYYAIESDLATVNGLVADLLGLFEKRTTHVGAEHAEG